MKQPLNISKLLATGRLAGLLEQARVLREMDALLEGLLPPPLNSHCRILSMGNNALTVAADSPVWAARLRFHAPQLADQLAQRLPGRRCAINVRVRPGETSHPVLQRRPATRPGAQGAAALQQAAQTVSDPELKTALLKLANRRGKHEP